MDLMLLDLPDDLLDRILNGRQRLTNREQALARGVCRRFRKVVAVRHVILRWGGDPKSDRDRLAAALRGGLCETLNCDERDETRPAERAHHVRANVLDSVATEFPDRVARLRVAHVWWTPRNSLKPLVSTFSALDVIGVITEVTNPPFVDDPRLLWHSVSVCNVDGDEDAMMRLARMARPPHKLELRFYRNVRDVEDARDAGLLVFELILLENANRAVARAAVPLATDVVVCFVDIQGTISKEAAALLRPTVRRLAVHAGTDGLFEALETRRGMELVLLGLDDFDVEGMLRLAASGALVSLDLPMRDFPLSVWERLLDAPCLHTLVARKMWLNDAIALFSKRSPSTLRHLRLGIYAACQPRERIEVLGCRLAELKGVETVALIPSQTSAPVSYDGFVRALTTGAGPPPALRRVDLPYSVGWVR